MLLPLWRSAHFFSVAIRWLIRELLNGLAINPKSFSLIRQTVMLEIISLRLVFSRKFHMESVSGLVTVSSFTTFFFPMASLSLERSGKKRKKDMNCSLTSWWLAGKCFLLLFTCQPSVRRSMVFQEFYPMLVTGKIMLLDFCLLLAGLSQENFSPTNHQIQGPLGTKHSTLWIWCLWPSCNKWALILGFSLS